MVSGEGAVMTTLDVVPKKKAGPSAEETAAKKLVRLAREQGLSLTGRTGRVRVLRNVGAVRGHEP